MNNNITYLYKYQIKSTTYKYVKYYKIYIDNIYIILYFYKKAKGGNNGRDEASRRAGATGDTHRIESGGGQGGGADGGIV